MSKIVLGYDGSEGANAALAVAIDVCKLFGDGLVVVFGAAPPGRLGEEWQAHAAAIRELAAGETASAMAACEAAGVPAELRIELSHPAEALLAAAEEVDARVIVVGTRGAPPIRAALVGSVPTKLLHLSERPVLVVPATEDD